MRVSNVDFLEDSGPVDLSASDELEPTWLGHIAQYSIQLVYTGTPAGAFKLQGSNDAGSPEAASKSQQTSGVVNWTDIADSSVTVAAAGNNMWNVHNVGYSWVRVVWTASGAGTTPVLTSARGYLKGF